MKWMSFSVLQDDFATWSTQIAAFTPAKQLRDTLVGTEIFPEAPPRLGENTSADDRQEHWRMKQEREATTEGGEKRKKPNLVLPDNDVGFFGLILIRHDCINEKGHGDKQRACKLLKDHFNARRWQY